MRMIGSIRDEQQAEQFVDYLLTQGIEGSAEEGSGGWVIWVEDDDHLDRAQAELQEFHRAPQDEKYQDARTAQRLRKEQESQARRLRQRHIDVRTRWHLAGQGAAPLTIGLIIICLIVAAASRLGEQDEPLLNWLYFATVERWAQGAELTVGPPMWEQIAEETPEHPTIMEPPGQYESWEMAPVRWVRGDGLVEIRQGQLWRLVTPMFIHFGILHLLFNLFWLHHLGGAIESRKGWLMLLLIVLGLSLAANVSQYAWSGWPLFGGMSGVVYGLFGYIWIKMRLQPHEQLALPQNTVLIMMGWLLLCMTGILGPIANAAHVAGLAGGAALAYAAYGTVHLRRWWRTTRVS